MLGGQRLQFSGVCERWPQKLETPVVPVPPKWATLPSPVPFQGAGA